MRNLKSSYELASERIIVPKKNNTKNNRNSSQMIDSALPDFIEAWKPPHGKDEFKDICLEIDGSNETKSLIQQYNSLNVNREEETQLKESDRAIYKDYPTIEWYGNFMGYNTQSRVNRKIAFSLSNKGIIVKVNAEDINDGKVNEQTKIKITEMSKAKVRENSPKIYSYLINENYLYGNKNIFYAVNENEKTLEKSKLFKINKLFNEIWVTRESLRKFMVDNGIEKPIYVMPIGVDHQRYNPKRKQFDFKQDLNEFIFLSILKWENSSGYDLVVKAFLEEFSDKDNVSLIIVSKDDKQKIIQEFNRIKCNINKSEEEMPHIALYDKFIQEKNMPNLYGASDAFISTSREEKCEIKKIEAAASGLPIVALKCLENSEFLNQENCFLIELKQNQKEIINKVKENIRYIYENYKESLDKSILLRKKVIGSFNWDKTVNKIYRRVIENFEK